MKASEITDPVRARLHGENRIVIRLMLTHRLTPEDIKVGKAAEADALGDPKLARELSNAAILEKLRGEGRLSMANFLVPDISDDGLLYGLYGCEFCHRLAVERKGTKRRKLSHTKDCSLVMAGVIRPVTFTVRERSWVADRYFSRPGN